MPRNSTKSGVASAFRQVQQQAHSLLTSLRKDIREKETELRRLRAEEVRLSNLLGAKSAAEARTGAGGAGGRINWREVLQQVPKQFKASDIRQVRGLKGKRPSEIFAAITRWIESGLVKRKSRGSYERS